MTINVEKIIENEDGSANVEFDMTYEELVEFARIGILQTLSDAAKHTIIQEEWIGECFELVKGAEDTEENYISLVEDQLKHEAEVRDYLREMCYYYNGLIEGDDPHERAFEIMRELGLIDEETMEWIDNEAETRTSPKTKSNDV